MIRQRVSHRVSILDTTLRASTSLSCAALMLEFGFEQCPISLGWISAAYSSTVLLLVASRVLAIVHQQRSTAVWKTVCCEGIGLAVVLGLQQWYSWPLRILLTTTVVYAVFVVFGSSISKSVHRFTSTHRQQGRVRPGRLMLLSFGTIIVVGASLLCLPKAMSRELRLENRHYATHKIVNNLLMATSATCVTGLVVYDVGSDYTRFGQVVLLVLMQLGGMGIMIYGSVFGLLLRRQLSLREALVLQDIYSHQTVGEATRMVKFICISTLAIEALATILLYDTWPAEITDTSTRWFYSAFHAVSAFCNAGLTLTENNLIDYRGVWQVYAVIMPLIVLGGIGFPVLSELMTLVQHRLGRRSQRSTKPTHISLHTKLVITTTALMIVFPTVVLFAFESKPSSGTESQDSLRALPAGQRLAGALFHTVSCRTAGFNVSVINTDTLSTGSVFLSCVLMFIGGSPASTAGGVKTVAIAVLMLGTISTLRQREQVEAFRRQVPTAVVRKAATVVIVMFTLVSAVVLLLSLTESASLAEILFESVSACSTVGLSTGLTPHLTIPGKLVIMLAMLAGRLGPLTILIALAGHENAAPYGYPTENIVIG